MNYRRIERVIVFLWCVRVLDLREIERELIRRHNIPAGAAGLIAGNEHLVEGDLQIFLRVLAGFAAGQHPFIDELAGGTRQE